MHYRNAKHIQISETKQTLIKQLTIHFLSEKWQSDQVARKGVELQKLTGQVDHKKNLMIPLQNQGNLSHLRVKRLFWDSLWVQMLKFSIDLF